MNAARSLKAKLGPEHLKVSGKLTAILGCLTGEEWTGPRMVELYVTSDGGVFGRNEDDCGANAWLGSAEDLTRNLRGVADAVGLTREERIALISLATPVLHVHGGAFDLAACLGVTSLACA